MSLVLVAILGLAIIFMFSLVAFAFYREYLDSTNGRQCRTAYECFVTLIHHGFVEGMYTVSDQNTQHRVSIIIVIIITSIYGAPHLPP